MIASTPLVQPVESGATATYSRGNDVDSDDDQAPAARSLLPNSDHYDKQKETATPNASPPPPAASGDSTQKEIHNSVSQNENSDGVHNDGDEVAPNNQLPLDSESVLLNDDPYPENIDNTNNTSSGSDSDSVIVLQGSTPTTKRNQPSQPAQFDSSEDFQESPLPKTPKRTAAKKSTPQSRAKKPASSTIARKRGLTSSASRDSAQGRAPVANKKVIVTRSMTTSRGSKNSVESGASTKPVREFYSWRTTALSAAKGSSRPPQPNNTKPTSTARKVTSHANTTSTQIAKGSLAASSVQTPSNRPATETSSAVKTTVASKSATSTVQTTPAGRRAPSARPSTPTTTRSTRNAPTKSTPHHSKPSRPASATSARPTTSTKSAQSSRTPGRAATKDNSTAKSSKGNSVSSSASTNQSRNTGKGRQRGTKRRLSDEDGDEAQAGAASPRKKARSFEPGSPMKDGISSEIALHTRGLYLAYV